MGRSRVRGAALAVSAMVAMIAASCVVPPAPGSNVVDLGEHRGQISSLSPVTYYYDGAAGEELHVAMNDGYGIRYLVDPEVGASVDAEVRGPDGASPPVIRALDLSRTYRLEEAGRYRITVRRASLDPAPARYTLWLSRDEFRGQALLGELEEPMPGQALSWDYGGTAGEHLNLSGARVFDSSGDQLPWNDRRFRQVTLPLDGTYRITAVGIGLVPAVSHDLDGGVIGQGLHATPELLASQRVDYRYVGTAGEVLQIRATGASTPVWTTLYAPGGAALTSTGHGLKTVVLPEDGEYVISVMLSYSGNESAQLTVGNG